MKKLFSGIVLFSVGLMGIYAFTPKSTKVATDTYNVVTQSSRVDWVGTKKSGYHTGFFTLKSGEVQLAEGKLVGGKFVIDLTSVTVTDGAGDRLTNHLKSKDFFDVAVNTEAVYEINNVKYTTDNTCSISGTLNMKGVSVPVSFTAMIRNADDKRFFGQAFFSIDRTQWGINYGPGNVANDVQLSVNLFASK